VSERVFFFFCQFGIVDGTFLSEGNKAGIQMALQIQDLVASIRKDGVEAGKQDAEKIIADAKKQAGEIVQQAHKDAATADGGRTAGDRGAGQKRTRFACSKPVVTWSCR
jgi:hypothetical protein